MGDVGRTAVPVTVRLSGVFTAFVEQHARFLRTVLGWTKMRRHLTAGIAVINLAMASSQSALKSA